MGDYVNDKKHGLGVFTWPDGRSYDGEWANGKQDGKGVYKGSKGNKRTGIWKEGRRLNWIDDTKNDYGVTE